MVSVIFNRDKMIMQIEEEQHKIKQTLLDIYSNHKNQKNQKNKKNDEHHSYVISEYNAYFEDELRLKQTQLEKLLLLIEANDNLEIKDKNLLDEIKMDQSLLLKEIEKIDKEIKSLIKQISK